MTQSYQTSPTKPKTKNSPMKARPSNLNLQFSNTASNQPRYSTTHTQCQHHQGSISDNKQDICHNYLDTIHSNNRIPTTSTTSITALSSHSTPYSSSPFHASISSSSSFSSSASSPLSTESQNNHNNQYNKENDKILTSPCSNLFTSSSNNHLYQNNINIIINPTDNISNTRSTTPNTTQTTQCDQPNNTRSTTPNTTQTTECDQPNPNNSEGTNYISTITNNSVICATPNIANNNKNSSNNICMNDDNNPNQTTEDNEFCYNDLLEQRMKEIKTKRKSSEITTPYDEIDLISECSTPTAYTPGKFLQLCDISPITGNAMDLNDVTLWPSPTSDSKPPVSTDIFTPESLSERVHDWEVPQKAQQCQSTESIKNNRNSSVLHSLKPLLTMRPRYHTKRRVLCLSHRCYILVAVAILITMTALGCLI